MSFYRSSTKIQRHFFSRMFFVTFACVYNMHRDKKQRRFLILVHAISWLTHESIATFFSGIACLYNSTEKLAWFTDLKNRTGSNNSLFVMSRFSNQLAAILERPPKARCLQANHTARLPKQVQNAANMFSQTSLNINITKLFCGLHSMLLLLPTAAILEISVPSHKERGKFFFYHLISIQSTHFVHQL